MVYAPQRRHAVASINNTVLVLGVLQHLYSPNVLIFISRFLAQAQTTSAATLHPTRSLLSLFLMTVAMNVVAVLLHTLDTLADLRGAKALLLDFIGQTYQASLTKILCLDALIFALQLTSLVVSYITNHSSNLPKSADLPYEDLLLPAYEDAGLPSPLTEPDIESGLRRRKGKTRAVDEEANELWLDDDADEATQHTRLLGETEPASGIRRREPPLIFALSLPYILKLVFTLPAPPAAPRAFAGGTPAVSPLATPTPERAATLPNTSAPSNANADGTAQDDDTDTDEEDTSAGRSGRRGAAGLMPAVGAARIPGDYWVQRGNGG